MWFSGPSSLMGCQIGCKEDKYFIIVPPNIKEKKREVKIAPPVLNVI